MRPPAHFPFLLACLLAGAQAARSQTVLVAAPQGRGDAACSQSDPCSLTAARNKARALLPGSASGITVLLAGGVYVLDSALSLDERDGGRPGARMTYAAAPGGTPILSGGISVTGWRIFDARRGIWRAQVPASLRTRQLYVNDVRATRARGPDRPPGFSKTRVGFRAPDSALSRYGNLMDVELVSLRLWKSFRCGIANAEGKYITLDAFCWDSAQAHAGLTMDEVSWVENAYELLDGPGEWYLDEPADNLYYKPRAGEDMEKAAVIAPALENLLEARGTADHPLGYLTLKGLTFAHSTWMQSSSDSGFPDLQGSYQYGNSGYGGARIASSVSFRFADSLVLEGNTFRALGGNGPALEAGCRKGRISGNVFFDISGNGLHVGGIIGLPADPREAISEIAISNNYVSRIGQEYHGCDGIFVGYASRVRILHNEVRDVPHTGISLGWGWGEKSSMRDNEVAYNKVHGHMNLMFDGGGIYTLGAQPGTRLHHNHVHDQVHEYGALYPDEGSDFMRWDSNVVERVARWLHVQDANINQDTIVDNFYDTPTATLFGRDCVLEPNVLVTGGNWPPAALAIMARAGLEPAFEGIKSRAGGTMGTPVRIRDRPAAGPLAASAGPRLILDLDRGGIRFSGPKGATDLLGKALPLSQNRSPLPR